MTILTYLINIAFGVADFISKYVDARMSRFSPHVAFGPEFGFALFRFRHVFAFAALE